MPILELTAIESDIAEIDALSTLVNKLISFGGLINDNKETLENLAQQMRNEKARNSFMTMDEVGFALRCNPDKAKEYLLAKKVPLEKAGKGYVVNTVQFKKYFEGGVKK